MLAGQDIVWHSTLRHANNCTGLGNEEHCTADRQRPDLIATALLCPAIRFSSSLFCRLVGSDPLLTGSGTSSVEGFENVELH